MSELGNVKKSVSAELPNKNEQLSLQNTEILVKSNLMRMQLNELLTNIRDSQTSSKRTKIDDWLNRLCIALKSCETGLAGKELSGSWLTEKNLQGFSLEGHSSGSVSVRFEKPESVLTVGSHVLNSGTSPFLNCDVAVVMPKSIFDSRDVLNYTYFNKRKLYLAAISEVLSDSGLCSSIEVSYFKSDQRKPFLILRPKFKTKYSVHLYPCAPTAVFKLVQLLYSKNNVRPDWWMREWQLKKSENESTGTKVAGSKRKSSGEHNPDPSSLSSTPHYNMAILEDLAIIPQYRMLTRASESCPCFKDVCMLLKVWLAQKNLRFGVNALDGHCAQIIVAYLFQTRRIGQQTTVLGAFQIVLSFFATTHFGTTDLHFAGASKLRNDGIWSAKLYHQLGKEVDDVQYNSLWRVSCSAVQDLQNEAKIALALMQQESDAVFHRIFLEGRNCLSRYDLIFHTPLKSLSSSTAMSISSDNATVASEVEDMTIPQFLCAKVLSVARRALGNRIKIISSSLGAGCSSVPGGTSSSATSWDTHAPPKNPLTLLVVTVGVVLDNDNAHRRVDKGADSSGEESAASELCIAAEDFRSFWGCKSELRRFKDGAIVDAVVWGEQDIQAYSIDSEATASEVISLPREVTGQAIVEAIFRYSIGMHVTCCAGAKGERIVCLGSALEASLPGTNYMRRGLAEGAATVHQKALDSTPKLRYLHAVEALDKLRSILTSDIKDLPLVFESITGSHAALRYTSTVPPMPHPLLLTTKDKMKEYSGVTLSLLTQPMLIIGQVEGGGKWPSEAEAARKIKTALLLRTGHLLRAQFEVLSQPAHDHLDIFYRGFIFRLVIFFTSENVGTTMIRSLQNSSLHHQCIRALHTQHSDSFSTSVRLLSMWMGKNFFSGFLSQRQVELLAAAVYLDPSSLCAPTTAASALFRILDLLGKHDFDLLPLTVNFNVDSAKGEAARESIAVFQAFKSSQKHLTSALLVVSSNDFVNNDGAGAILSDSTLERVSLSLIQKSARESSQRLMARLLFEEETTDLLGDDIFEASTIMSDQCNIVLHFSSALHCKGSRGHLSGPKYASLKVYSNTVQASCTPSRLVVGDSSATSANLVQEGIVQKLRKQFKDVAIFFWNESEGDVLGVVLKPSAFVSSSFSTTSSRRKISLSEGKAHSPMLSDISQIAMNIYTSGNGCFSDISFR